LQSNSPCINIGNNGSWASLSNSLDLDGNKRIWPQNGIVDMGAYEYGSQKDYPVVTKTKLYGITVNKLYGNSSIKLFGK